MSEVQKAQDLDGPVAHRRCGAGVVEWLKYESLGYCPIGLASFWILLIDSIAYIPYIVLNQASYTLLF